MLLCPDFAGIDKIEIYGTSNSILTKSLDFKIDRCDSEKRTLAGLPECYGNTEYDGFIKDLQVDTYGLDWKLDFQNFDALPVTREHHLFGKSLLNNKAVSK